MCQLAWRNPEARWDFEISILFKDMVNTLNEIRFLLQPGNMLLVKLSRPRFQVHPEW